MKKISLEDRIYEVARKYAEEEGFPSVTAFIRHLISSYPFVKALKSLCEQGMVNSNTHGGHAETNQERSTTTSHIVSNTQYEATYEQTQNLPKFSIKDSIFAFIGERGRSIYKISVFDRIIVEKGTIYIPFDSVKDRFSEEKKKAIQKDFDCSITMTVIDDENYLCIIPNVALRIAEDEGTKTSKLKDWYINNIKELLKCLAKKE